MTSSTVVLRAYRALLTQTRVIGERGSDTLTLRLPVEGSWGHGQTFKGTERYRRAVQRYLGDLAQSSQPAYLSGLLSELSDDPKCSITLERLKETIRNRFRSHIECSPKEAAPHIASALRALRVLSEQTHLMDCSSESVSDGVHVEVTSAFLHRQRDPEQPHKIRYYFTYRARIQNVGRERVKVVGRAWSIHNGITELYRVPKGNYGVVGCTPILNPGDCFEYCSGTDLDTMSGSMEGSFQVVVLDANDRAQRRFDAVVKPFRLIGHNAGPLVDTEDFPIEIEIGSDED